MLNLLHYNGTASHSTLPRTAHILLKVCQNYLQEKERMSSVQRINSSKRQVDCKQGCLKANQEIGPSRIQGRVSNPKARARFTQALEGD